jgi:choline dehydrogenase-like flavoprotein
MAAPDASHTFDVIVVGAGSAGCALAARLSADVNRRVLLLEAGPDYRTADDFPRDVALASSMAATVPGHPNNWNFIGQLMPGRSFPVARGKGLGGSSTINGTYFVRARPADFDELAEAGNKLWSYERVLPYFCKSEHDVDFSGPYHGDAGPMPVGRIQPDRLHPVSRAFVQACLDAGFPDDPDKNAPGTEGIGPVPRNVRNGIRMNAGITYIAPNRDRPNLTIIGGTFVTRVLFEGTRAVGVAAVRDSRPVTFRASEIVLSAGAIKSPHLLMLSGIGPAADLRQHGIDVVHDSPGVGTRLKDHPTLMVNFQVRDKGMPLPEELQPFETCLNYTTPESSVESDVQLMCGVVSYAQLIKGTTAADGRRARVPSYVKRPLATLSAMRQLPTRLLMQQARRQNDLTMLVGLETEDSVGELRLTSAEPTDAPAINLNYLSEPADLPRLQHNLEVAIELLNAPSFRALDVKLMNPGRGQHSRTQLQTWIAANLGSAFHSFNTVPMGPASDPVAVVDQHCRVHGVEGLRVADLSIMPRMRRGPAATALMIGERVAGLIDEHDLDDPS